MNCNELLAKAKLKCATIQSIEQMKMQIAMVSDLDFAEQVSKITSAKSNPYTVEKQISRMLDAIDLLKRGCIKEDVLILLEKNIEGAALLLMKDNMEKLSHCSFCGGYP